MNHARSDRRPTVRQVAICTLAAVCVSCGGCVSPSGDWFYRKTGIDLSPQAFEQAPEDAAHVFEGLFVIALYAAYGLGRCYASAHWMFWDGASPVGEVSPAAHHPAYGFYTYTDADFDRWGTGR